MLDRYENQTVLDFAQPVQFFCALTIAGSLIGICSVTAYLSAF